MYNPQSTLTMIAFLSLNLVSAFVCQAAIPLPTSFFLQKYNSPPSSRHIPTKDRTALLHRSTILQQHRINGDIFSSNSSLMVRGGGGGGGGGGALSSSTTNDETADGTKAKDLNLTIGSVLSSLWGSCGVVYILMKAIKRVLPIALEPFGKGEGVVPLTQFQLAAYISTCLWFAYVEGYKGFQCKFSPLVVSRSFTLQPSTSPFHHILLGPLYSMGLFHATKKRMIVSWSVSIGVAMIVAAVKRLPYPWRNIVDAGVVFGLGWGSISILGGYIISSVTGIAPIDIDPALPEKKE